MVPYMIDKKFKTRKGHYTSVRGGLIPKR